VGWLTGLTRFWRELLRDILLTGSGLAVVGSQVVSAQPSPLLIGAGLSLTFPSTFVKIREILISPSGTEGVSGPPSEPPGPAPSSVPSGPRSGGAGE
jgi:hypothetical protein